jgi:signal transduction histidine kinase
MLAFSRHKDIAPHPLDINGIIRESDTLIQRTVEALVEVGYSPEESLWPAIADRVRFEVAILNLAGNARDAMPLGPGMSPSSPPRRPAFRPVTMCRSA